MPVTVCNICGHVIYDNELPAVDEDGAPCHEACLEELHNQEEE